MEVIKEITSKIWKKNLSSKIFLQIKIILNLDCLIYIKEVQ